MVNTFSEKQDLLPKPSFHIRMPVEQDLPARLKLDEHVLQYSLRATSDSIAPAATIRAVLSKKEIPNLLHLVAVSGPSTPGKGAGPAVQPTAPVPSRWIHRVFSRQRTSQYHPKEKKVIPDSVAVKAVDYTVEDEAASSNSRHSITNSALFQGLLGYAILLPFQEGGRGPIKVFERTATMIVFTADERVLGAKLWHDVNSALFDETFSRSRERGDRFKQIVINTPFRDDQPQLVAYRDILLEKGFKQVGVNAEIMEKNGLLLDRINMQRAF